MNHFRLALAGLLALLVLLSAHPGGAQPSDDWSAIDRIVEDNIAAGNVPGAVVLVGRRGKVLYRKAFGSRSLKPQRTPMTPDTVFDLASLTKVVSTTSAVMDLVEQGKIRLADPAARYWPEFAQNGKARVTVRQLLTHNSGLPAFVNYYTRFGDPAKPGVQDQSAKVLEAIAGMPLTYPSDTRFVYSDLGFITLGEIVRRVSGEPLDQYVRSHVFEPLGMKDTGYNPGPELSARAAPTTERGGRPLQGAVHDPNAAVLNGVAGHAGLFSTIDDLSKFARMLLSGDGPASRRYPLSPATVRMMSTPHSAPNLPVRGLGWDIDSPYSWVRGDLMPLGSFGHTGFTGTWIWVDPYRETYVIALSNRVHPDEKGNANIMWPRIANVVASLSGEEPLAPRPRLEKSTVRVLTGIDVLQRDGFKALEGRKVGLITNRTGVNRQRASTIDLIHAAPGVKLVALFAPEHGIRAEADEFLSSTSDPKTGLPIYSLYERGRYRPTPEQLQGVDTLVYDIQDVGVRYYTYITTLGLCMEAAAEKGIRFVVLDRPNPNNGRTIDGPLLEPDLKGFASHYRLPTRHGMTVGELAQLYKGEFNINCDLTVIPMENWRRRMWFDETGVPWVDPSPNIRNTLQAELYVGIGMIEAANISVGRGTDTPFERLGAPWIDGNRLADELNRRRIPALSFVPIVFTPVTREFKGERCEGVEIRLHDREAFQGVRTAIEIQDALIRLWPDKAKIENNKRLIGSSRIVQMILDHRPVEEIVQSYAEDVRTFEKQRAKYLLYR